jgi:hypothetical protein
MRTSAKNRETGGRSSASANKAVGAEAIAAARSASIVYPMVNVHDIESDMVRVTRGLFGAD